MIIFSNGFCKHLKIPEESVLLDTENDKSTFFKEDVASVFNGGPALLIGVVANFNPAFIGCSAMGFQMAKS